MAALDSLSPPARRIADIAGGADASLDAASFGALFVPDGRFSMADHPDAIGPEAVAQVVAGLFAHLAAMRHDHHHTFECGDALAWQATVTWTLKSGEHISARYMNLIVRDGDMVREYRIHIDPSELLAEISG